MKKYLAIIIFLAIPSISFATSGACSYNGGVNCAAGPAVDGNAICNDGSESSTLYSQTDECSVNACTEAHVVSEFSQYINLPAHIRKTLFQLNANLINQLTQAKNTAIQALQQSNAIVPQQLSNSPCLAVAIELQNDMQQAENACSVKYGSNAVTGNYLSSCICASGYEWNTTKTQCVVIPNCPANSSDMGGSCVANLKVPPPVVPPTTPQSNNIRTNLIPQVKKKPRAVTIPNTTLTSVNVIATASDTANMMSSTTVSNQNTTQTPAVLVHHSFWQDIENFFRRIF